MHSLLDTCPPARHNSTPRTPSPRPQDDVSQRSGPVCNTEGNDVLGCSANALEGLSGCSRVRRVSTQLAPPTARLLPPLPITAPTWKSVFPVASCILHSYLRPSPLRPMQRHHHSVAPCLCLGSLQQACFCIPDSKSSPTHCDPKHPDPATLHSRLSLAVPSAPSSRAVIHVPRPRIHHDAFAPPSPPCLLQADHGSPVEQLRCLSSHQFLAFFSLSKLTVSFDLIFHAQLMALRERSVRSKPSPDLPTHKTSRCESCPLCVCLDQPAALLPTGSWLG